MNKVIINQTQKEETNYQMGDILCDPDHGSSHYILAKVREVESTETKWTAISLEDGNRWRGSSRDVKEATQGLIFWGRNVKIKLERQ